MSLTSKVTKVTELQNALWGLSRCARVGVDTETTGLDPHTDEIRLIQIAGELANGARVAYVIDVWAVGREEVRKFLSPLFQVREVRKIFMNAKFDLAFLRSFGIEVAPPIDDVSIMYRVATNGEGESFPNLITIINEVLGLNLPQKNKKKMQQSPWSAPILTDEQINYAGSDAYFLLPLYECLRAELIKEETPQGNLLDVYEGIEAPALIATADMEYNGIPVDTNIFDKLREELEPEILALDAEIKRLFEEGGAKIENLNSPKQIIKAFQEIGIEIGSSAEDVLKEIDHPIAGILIKLKEKIKMMQFVKKLPTHINPTTGRIHCSFNQMGTVTGRFSSSKPNMQQMPRPVRGEKTTLRDFIKASPGHKIIVADYSQVELVIAAEITQDPVMVEAYRNGEDIHKLTASLLLEKSVKDITKEDRQIAKAVNFG